MPDTIPENESQAHGTGAASAKGKKFLIVGVIIFALVSLAAAAIFSNAQRQKEAERASYIDSLNELMAQTIRGGAIAEDMCNITKKVWYNTIYEKKDSGTDKYTREFNGAGEFHDDFNTSLSILYADDNVQTVISGLRASRETVDGIIAGLQNPPDEFSACYSVADSLYDAYCGLIDLAISPSGSFRTYSENFGEYDEDMLKYYHKLEALIPDK